MTNFVVALFADRDAAESAVDDLIRSGVARERIGVALADRLEERAVAAQMSEHPNRRAAAEETVKYAAWGGLAGLVAGVAALAIPGVGPVLAAGPLFTAFSVLTGAGTGAVAAGMGAGLQALEIKEGDAAIYREALRNGGVIVTVEPTSGDDATALTDRLRQLGATDLDIQARRHDWQQIEQQPAADGTVQPRIVERD